MTIGLAILVKTPACSPVKSRLARGSHADFAEAFHLRAARAVAEVAGTCAGLAEAQGVSFIVYWAVAEASAANPAQWPGLPCLLQPQGGLGARMAGIHAQLLARHDAAILVGADSPQIQPCRLLEAALWLSSPASRCVLGPARDGGFWLIGSNCPLPARQWEKVAYSQADTAARFREAFTAMGEWVMLPELVDVDAVEDLVALRNSLRALEAPLPAQSALLAWLDTGPEACAATRPRNRTDA